MEVNKGVYRQTTIDKTPQGSWLHARNISIGSSLRNVSSEQSFVRLSEFLDLDGDILGFIVLNSDLVVFTVDSGLGKIIVYDDMGFDKLILASTGLNFNLNNPIRGDYTYNFNGERIITWWDGLEDNANTPKVLNIDCLPFEVDPVGKTPLVIGDLVLLKLFSDLSCLDITLDAVHDGGGELPVGAYYIVRAYEHPDGSTTNFSPPSNPIIIYEDDSTDDYNLIDGDPGGLVAGDFTSKSFTVSLSNLSTQFTKIKIGIIARNAGVITAKILPVKEFTESDFTFIVTGTEIATEVPVAQLAVPNVSYSRVHTGTFLENRLHLANLKKDTEIDYQAYANNIKAKWFRTEDVVIGQHNGSFKDPLMIFDMKSMPSDEVMAFYCGFGLIDGTTSNWFHVPGLGPTAIGIGGYDDDALISTINGTNPSNDLAEALLVAPSGKYYQFFNNAKSNGDLSFWENENEVYADLDCSDIKDSNDDVIGTLRNEKVRHHKFPSLKKLDDFGNPFYIPVGGSATEVIWKTAHVNSHDWNAGGDPLEFDFITNPVTGVEFNITQTIDRLIIECNTTISVKIDYYMRVLANSNAYIQVTISSPNGEVHRQFADTQGASAFASQSVIIESSLSYTLQPGWIITMKAERENIIDDPTVWADLVITKNNFNDINTTSKTMGVRFSDIHIPDEIKAKVNCIYFGYAKRNTLNSTKLVMTAIDRENTVGLNLNKEFVVRSFDLLATKPIVQVEYLKTIYTYNFAIGSTISNLLITLAPTYADSLRKIKTSGYKPKIYFDEDGITTVEDEFLLETTNDYLPPTAETIVFASLHNYITDAYKNRNEQKIAVIGHLPTNVTTGDFHNGDVHINYLSLIHNVPSQVGAAKSKHILSYIIESISNAELRHENEGESYYPKNNFGATIDSETDTTENLNYYTYNADFSSINDLIPQAIFKCEEICEDKSDSFPVRIARSLKSENEDGTSSWRTFKVNEFFDMKDRDKGEVYRIDKYGGSLMINQFYSFFVAQVKDIIFTNDIDLFIGRGDIFDRDPREVVVSGGSNAYVGCQSLWGAKVTKHGYVFWDLNAGKIFQYKGQLEEISANGLKYFFEGERKRIKRNTGEYFDNPFINRGITIGYDEIDNRMLFTKLDIDTGFTWSYSFHIDKWICQHDYIPNGYADNNLGQYALRNPSVEFGGGFTKPAIYDMQPFTGGQGQGGGGEGGGGLYFDETTPFPLYIDIVFTSVDIVMRFMSIGWRTEVFKDDLALGMKPVYEKTLTHIMAYDHFRCTGLVPLVYNKDIVGDNIRRVGTSWNFGTLRDIVIDKNERIISRDGIINEVNLNNSKLFFEKSVFNGNFIVVRFQYDNVEGNRIVLKDVTINPKLTER